MYDEISTSFTVKIKYKEYTGFLDPFSGKVKFYDIIYKSINDAIVLEINIARDKEFYDFNSLI